MLINYICQTVKYCFIPSLMVKNPKFKMLKESNTHKCIYQTALILASKSDAILHQC